RYNFFEKYTETEQNNIRTAWYEYMNEIKVYIMFFDYLPIYINQQENKKIFMNKKITTTWSTTDDKIIEAIHSPSEKIQINISNGKIQVAPFKLHTEITNVPITNTETNKIIEQNNYTNKNLQTIGSQLSRIENIIQMVKENKIETHKTKPFTHYKIPRSQIKQLTLNEINQKLKELVVPNTPETSTPRAPQKDKNKIINVIQEIEISSDDSNIDGMNEYHIINKLQEMTMVSNAHKIKNNSDKTVVNLLIVGFTGQLKCLWDNVLTTQQQTILNTFQTNEICEPILDLNNEPIEDVVATLIYNITKYFIGD
ncbi:LOW QUALITY PROTEIN: hypothetical protein CFOL_v3_21715, partial [Cephalotus follicularis]